MRQLSLTAVLTCLTLFAPTEAFYPYIPKGWGDFSTQRRPDHLNHDTRSPSKIDSVRAITLPLRRYQIPPQDLHRRDSSYDITSAPKPTQTNSVGIDQDGTDYTYMSSIQLGTSQMEYHMLLDTAASNTWVMSSECKTDVCNFHNTFGKDDSTSLKTTDKTFSVGYGTGNVNGTVASDDAHFAGFTVPLSFGLASGVSQEFASYPLDGIIGLGRTDVDGSSGTNAPSIMDVLVQNKMIKDKVFGVHLGRHATPPIDGELNLGAPNPNRYDGDLRYINVEDNERGFWEIPIDDSGVNGQSTGLGARFAILDTGTSFLLLPPSDASKVHNLIPGAKLNGDAYTVPCDATAAVQLTFGGHVYNISTLDYVGGKNSQGDCNSQIIARKTFDEDQWLVGDVFLRNVYTLFDYDKSRVGFGVNGAGDSEPTDPTPTAAGAPSSSAGVMSSGPTGASATMSTGQQNAEPSASQGAAASNPDASKGGMMALGIAIGAVIAAL